MTIGLCLKVSDGLVFGADSAATVFDTGGERVYTSAEKIINLQKKLPVGMVTYGLGALGDRSVISLAKDLRNYFTEPAEERRHLHLDPQAYTIGKVADHVRTFFYEKLYQEEVAPLVEELRQKEEEENGSPSTQFPVMGFIVGGISAGNAKSEIWTVEVQPDGSCAQAEQVWGTGEDGVVIFKGVQEPLLRLLMGVNSDAINSLLDEGLAYEEIQSLLINWAPLAHGAMPIQDAVDLVDYLASVVTGYLRFSAGPDVVAPPIDLAAITKHERFKWVRRKHYYPKELNP